jgi:hypothetical protein
MIKRFSKIDAAEPVHYFLNAFSTLGVSAFKLAVSTVAGAGKPDVVSGPVDSFSVALLQAMDTNITKARTVNFFIVGF